MEGVVILIAVLVGLWLILTKSDDDDDNNGNWGGGCFA